MLEFGCRSLRCCGCGRTEIASHQAYSHEMEWIRKCRTMKKARQASRVIAVAIPESMAGFDPSTRGRTGSSPVYPFGSLATIGRGHSADQTVILTV